MILRFFLASVVVLGLPGVASGQDALVTQVRVFTPFAPDGGPVAGLNVAGEASGSCFTGSLADPARPDAWRCTDEGSEIHDPCFANPFGEGLACAESPFAADAVLLSLQEELPDAGSDALDLDEMPWALELANSRRCVRQTGAAPAVAGLRLDYACGDGGFAAGIDRSRASWRAFYWTDDRSLSLDAIDIVTAWY